MFGTRVTLSDGEKAYPSTAQAVEAFNLPSGRVLRHKQGSPRLNHRLIIVNPTNAEYQQFRHFINYLDQGVAPFVLIPDDAETPKVNFRLVFVPQGTRWNAVRSEIILPELI